MIDLPPPHPASLEESDLLKQCRTERGRGSGPGGQHRNKVETAIILTHTPSGVSAGASERRQQSENLAKAQRRLRMALAIQVRTVRDLSAGASDLWRSRVQKDGRIACNAGHRDFPALLAEALDILHMKRWDVKPTALLLDVSPSQLVKLIRKEPAAFAAVNARRIESGLHGLK